MRKWRNDFKKSSNYEPYYDIFDDFDAIESSFAEQYGIRLRKELKTTSYGEFSAYLSGLNGETALGHLVRIRSEKDLETIKKFSPSEKEIRDKWNREHQKVYSEEEYQQAMKNIERMFIAMGKEGK